LGETPSKTEEKLKCQGITKRRGRHRKRVKSDDVHWNGAKEKKHQDNDRRKGEGILPSRDSADVRTSRARKKMFQTTGKERAQENCEEEFSSTWSLPEEGRGRGADKMSRSIGKSFRPKNVIRHAAESHLEKKAPAFHFQLNNKRSEVRNPAT